MEQITQNPSSKLPAMNALFLRNRASRSLRIFIRWSSAALFVAIAGLAESVNLTPIVVSVD